MLISCFPSATRASGPQDTSMTPLTLFEAPSKSVENRSKEEKPVTKLPPKPGSGRHLVEGRIWEFFNPLRPSRLNPIFGRHLVDRKILEPHFRVLRHQKGIKKAARKGGLGGNFALFGGNSVTPQRSYGLCRPPRGRGQSRWSKFQSRPGLSPCRSRRARTSCGRSCCSTGPPRRWDK